MTLELKKKGITDHADLDVAVVTKTSNYTITTSDDRINCDASGGAFTVTLPAMADVPKDALYYIKKVDSSANAVTITQGG
jgi:hypothetical protein